MPRPTRLGVESRAGAPRAARALALRRPRILLAEDDAALRDLVRESLEASGFLVEAVSDGGRLLVALTHALRGDPLGHPVDLVLTDIRMPVITGLSLASTLRSTRRRIPIVLMTAFPDESVRREAAALGLPLLEKPFDDETLERLVRSALHAAEALRRQ